MAIGRKTGGRAKGTPNKPKPSKELVEGVIAEQLAKYYETGVFEADLSELSAKERILVMERYTQYVLPKKQSQKMDVTTQSKVDLSLREKLANMALIGGNAEAARIKPNEDNNQ